MPILTILIFVLILSFLIFVHELGHFIAAKRAGITVEEFAIGFPPRAVKLWQDEGKITLDGDAFPISRRAKVPKGLQVGSHVHTESKVRADGKTEITAIQLLNKSADDADAADISGQVVEAVDKPTEYTINWIPFGGYVKMVGEEDPSAPGSFASKSKLARFIVLVAGAVMNLITAVIVFTIMFATGTPEVVGEAYIIEVVPNSPAEEAGILPEDVVLQADDYVVENSRDLSEYISDHRGEEIALTLQREGVEQQVSLTPRVNPPPGEGSIGVLIGTRPIDQRVTRLPLGESIVMGTTATVGMIVQTFVVPIAVLRDMIPAEQARPVGPVGIYNLTDSAVGATVETGFVYPILLLTAILSTALAVTNLLPLPALDGGRILFVIIEAIRGKRVSPEKEGAIHFVGLALLLTLMVVVSYNDISNPIDVPDWTNLFN